jgi:hypothetical protein
MTIAYISAALNRSDPDPDLDWPIFKAACEKKDLAVELALWNDEAVDWGKYALAVLRSPWDYSEQREKFLDWALQAEKRTKLLNDSKTISENTDKRYLKDLANFVPVIPTIYLSETAVNAGDLQELIYQAKTIAIKPNVGAGASLAGRTHVLDTALRLIANIHEAGHLAMVQPYLDEVDQVGEIAIVIIGGEISHAVKKVPALTRGGHGDAQELVPVTEEYREFISQISKGVSNWNSLLYARVDVVPTISGLILMELELTEPTLFFPQYPPAADKLVNEILKRLSS